jgi:hypothetical protein
MSGLVKQQQICPLTFNSGCGPMQTTQPACHCAIVAHSILIGVSNSPHRKSTCQLGVRVWLLATLALYIFTSGTTGLPKAAIISHARWLITGDVMQITMDVQKDDCFYCFLPLYHGAASLSAGATAFACRCQFVAAPQIQPHRILDRCAPAPRLPFVNMWVRSVAFC